MTAERRRIRVTAANLKHNHLYVTGLRDFFPAEAVGGPRRRNGTGDGFELILEGLDQTVVTDICSDAKSGRPRFLRCRREIGKFYKHHALMAGCCVELQRVAEGKYRLGLPRPRAAEFFAGIGLMRLALERQGWEVVFANDIDADKEEMYRHNWPNDDHFKPGDIHDLKPADIPECELFTASFPCNDLSIAGKWEGLDGKQSSAFWGLTGLLREMPGRRPPIVLLENVVGFLMNENGRDFEKALRELNDLGYLVDAVILNASHWVPQSRARLFVIAKRDVGQEARTCPMVSDSRPELLYGFMVRHPEIGWDIQPLPPLPERKLELAEIIEDLPEDDPHWWNQPRAKYFFAQLSAKHEAEARKMIEANTISYATAFRRVRQQRSMAELRTDGIAGCLRTPRGGSGRQILFKAGKGHFQVRLLTARECARLQGVPEGYRIEVGLNQALFGFGDAVCVPAIEWIVSNYLSKLVERSGNS